MIPELQKFREKYPDYGDMDDITLATKLGDKYPEYSDLVDKVKQGSGALPIDSSPISHEPVDDRPWYQKAVSNLPSSTLNYLGSTIKALTSPMESGQGLGRIATDPALRNAIYQSVKSKVESPEELTNWIAENPADFLSLASVPVAGAGGIARTAGLAANLPKVARAGEIISGVGRGLDPATMAIKGGEALASSGRKVTQQIAGGISGLGRETAEAAFRYSPEFRAAQRGEVTGGEIVSKSRSAVEDIQQGMNREFGDYMKSIKSFSATTPIDVNKPTRKFNEILSERGIQRLIDPDGNEYLSFKDTRLHFNKPAQDDIRMVDDILKNASNNQQFYSTPEGLHTLKQQLYDHMKTFEKDTKTNSIAKGVWASIRGELGDKVPGYNDMNKKYERMSDLVHEIQGAVTGNDKTLMNTSLNKLHNMMKEDLDFRRMIVSELESQTGKSIKDLVAGYMSRGWMPQSYIGKQVGYGSAFGLGSLGAATSNPGVLILGLAGASLASPKIMSEIMHTLGRTSRSYEYIRKSGVGYPIRQGALRGYESKGYINEEER